MPDFKIFWPIILVPGMLAGCDIKPEIQKERPLVYSGMSSEELKKVLGNPVQVDTTGFVFNSATQKRNLVVKWIYEKRVVVLINDTVKTPNFQVPGKGD